MTDEADNAFARVMRATKRLDEAWEKRSEAREELSLAIKELNDAGEALVQAWNPAEE